MKQDENGEDRPTLLHRDAMGQEIEQRANYSMRGRGRLR